MRHLLLALHLLFAIFAVGPLVHAATTASRGVKAGDAAAVRGAARTTRVYSYASLLVVVLGFALMSQKGYGGRKTEFSETWIWLSLVLYVIALGVAVAVLIPALESAAGAITDATPAGNGAAASSLVARVAAAGGLIALLFAGIVFLMVYQPGA